LPGKVTLGRASARGPYPIARMESSLSLYARELFPMLQMRASNRTKSLLRQHRLDLQAHQESVLNALASDATRAPCAALLHPYLPVLLSKPLDHAWTDPTTEQTLLHAVCHQGGFSTFKQFTANAPTALFRVQDADGFTPFHRAVQSGNGRVVHFLLAQHHSNTYVVAPSLENAAGQVPLETAVLSGAPAHIVDALVACCSRHDLQTIALKLPTPSKKRYKLVHSRTKKRKRLQ
jgi:ankyrin repeat protein